MYAQAHEEHWVHTRIRSRRMPTRRLNHALRYKIIAIPMNSNEFTEFDMKRVKNLT